MARRKIVAGNWKMNMTPSEAVALVNTLKPLVASDETDVVFCVPAIDIIPVAEACKGTNIAVGAENMYYEEKDVYKRQTLTIEEKIYKIFTLIFYYNTGVKIRPRQIVLRRLGCCFGAG